MNFEEKPVFAVLHIFKHMQPPIILFLTLSIMGHKDSAYIVADLVTLE